MLRPIPCDLVPRHFPCLLSSVQTTITLVTLFYSSGSWSPKGWPNTCCLERSAGVTSNALTLAVLDQSY